MEEDLHHRVSGDSIRRRFLDFYASRGHTVLPSASLVPDDPTVLLTIAGMLQFKPIFLGQVWLLMVYIYIFKFDFIITKLSYKLFYLSEMSSYIFRRSLFLLVSLGCSNSFLVFRFGQLKDTIYLYFNLSKLVK